MDYQTVDLAITGRHSVRAFTPQAVDKATILELLNVAARAPSGTNCQPWNVYVATGAARDRIVAEVCALHDAARSDKTVAEQYTESYQYYPEQWISPYIDRRRENGWGLYGLLGIEKGEKDKMHEQHQRNFKLFDAPVALFFTVNKAMGIGSKMDIAMMMQNLMVAAFPEQRDNAPAGQALAADAHDTGESAVSLSAMLASRYTGKQPFTTPALTDDFAPVERYTLVLLRQ